MSRRAYGFVLFIAVVCYLPHVLVGTWVYEDAGVLARIAAPANVLHMRAGLVLASKAQAAVSVSPVVFHAVSLLLHLLVSLMMLVFAHSLGLDWRIARLAAAVVLAPALAVEGVAYAAQQGELLGALFVLAACTVAAREWWRWSTALLMLLYLGLGMWAQESAVAGLLLVPLVILLRRHAARPTWARPWLPAAVSLGLIVLGVVGYGGLSTLVNIGEAPGVRVDALQWGLVQSAAALRSLGNLLIPLGPFTVDYDYDAVSMTVRWWAAGAWLTLPVVTLWLHRSQPAVALGLGWLFLAVLPRLIVQTPRSYLNDGQAYLMLPGFALAIASLTPKRV